MIYYLLYRYFFMNRDRLILSVKTYYFVSFYGQYQTIPISVGLLTITNIPSDLLQTPTFLCKQRKKYILMSTYEIHVNITGLAKNNKIKNFPVIATCVY